jgi:BirA family biotin operon repressor/biotin-[acetyl-CoA-carboxylase] ligase
MAFGTPHRHYARTDSTNTRARELAAAGAQHGTVLTAAEQTEGRGRQGRTWTAPPGRALLYSALVRPLERRHMLLPLAAPLAVAETAEQLAPGIECVLKWPNDVLVGARKLAGIQIEARPQDGWAVVGVGLNLTTTEDEFPEELRESATSLAIERGRHLSGVPRRMATTRAGAALSARLEWWLTADEEAILGAWRERDALRGREVAWEGGSGVADGVDDRGYLVVVTAAGTRVAVGAGEVHLTSF